MTTVFLHGGGDLEAARPATFGLFAGACLTGRVGPLLVVAVAASPAEASETAAYYVDLFAALGVPADRLAALPLEPDQSLTAEQVAAAGPCGLFVCGGETPLYHRVLCTDLSWVAYVREHAIPYGGTSAGAAIAAGQAILGGWRSGDGRPILFQGASEGLDGLTVRLGACLVPFAVEVHAGQMGTLTRLIHVVAGGQAAEGWGIDEDTLLIVSETGIEIAGPGFAYHVTRRSEVGATVRVFAAPASVAR